MPIEFDKRPGSIKFHQRTRDGRLIKDIPPEKASEVAPIPTMRIRILRRITGSRSGSFEAGQITALPVELARSWIGVGLAEEDKMIDAAPETKAPKSRGKK